MNTRVLPVEDDVAVRDALSLVLKLEGYQVIAVSSLEEARQKARELDCLDVLVTDYHLNNGETGTQVMAALRADSSAPLSTVLLTGDPTRAGKKLNGNPYLRVAGKPIRAHELVIMIKGLLAERESQA